MYKYQYQYQYVWTSFAPFIRRHTSTDFVVGVRCECCFIVQRSETGERKQNKTKQIAVIICFSNEHRKVQFDIALKSVA